MGRRQRLCLWQGSALPPRRVFDPLDTLFAIELVTLSYSVRVFIHRLVTLSPVSKQRAVPAALSPKSRGAEGVKGGDRKAPLSPPQRRNSRSYDPRVIKIKEAIP